MKSKTNTILIVVALLTTAVLGAYIYSVYYLQGLIQKTSDTKEEVDKTQSQYKRLQLLHDAMLSAGGQKSKVTDYFIPASGAIDFVTRFEDTARGSGLQFNTLSLDTVAEPDLEPQGKELLHVSFETNGTWSQTMHFLSIVESLPYSVHIETVNLDSSLGTPALVGSGGSSDKISVGDISYVASRKWRMVISLQIVKIKDDAR